MTTFEPSRYQQAIFDFVADPQAGNAIIEAVAGSGKSTTIVKALEMIPDSQRVLFLAFNRSFADELKSRVPAHVEARTLNSLGYGACMSALRPIRPQIDGSKCRKIARDALPDAADSFQGQVLKLVSLCKAHGIAPADKNCRPLADATDEALEELVETYDIDIPSDADARLIYEWAREVLAANNRITHILDYDDQLYMPVVFGWPLYKFDFVMVDEAQDLSLVQRALVKKALKPGGRLVAVGDSCQSIYAFRGADSRSMEMIRKDFNCHKLPLSISYRCPKAVVAEAKRFVPHIEAAETARDGIVDTLATYGPKSLDDADLIVCRNTAPLVKLAYKLMAARKSCHIMGKDLGEGLKALIKRLRAKDLGKLLVKLFEWETRETEKALAADKPEAASRAQDKADVIRFLAGQVDSKDAMMTLIDRLFAGGGVTLATVHKAKGLEAQRVFILDSFLMPSKYARSAEALQQEHNLIYVAVTRAKNELIYIDSDGFKA